MFLKKTRQSEAYGRLLSGMSGYPTSSFSSNWFGVGNTKYIILNFKNEIVGIPGNNILLFSRTKHVNTCSIKRVPS